jgi:hypothetical protein
MYKKSGVVFEQYKEDDEEDELAIILEEEYLDEHDEELTSLEI